MRHPLFPRGHTNIPHPTSNVAVLVQNDVAAQNGAVVYLTHFLRKMAAAWIILGSVSVGFAQQQMPPIPPDPNVRIGKLDNGLTYYIRHNELPEKRADFYIAQKVGSILEEDNQRGLAHFLEHMCFNGTKNFPDKTPRIHLYLQRL